MEAFPACVLVVLTAPGGPLGGLCRCGTWTLRLPETALAEMDDAEREGSLKRAWEDHVTALEKAGNGG